MGRGLKACSSNGSAHFLCGGIWPQEFRVFGLDVAQLTQESIVFRVRNLRAVFPVVEGVVPRDLADQAGDSILGFFVFRICQICVFTVKSLLKPLLRWGDE